MKSSGGIRVVGAVLGASCLVVATGGCTGPRWTETQKGTLRTVTNEEGATLGYSSTSGVTLLVEDGFAFKDLNRNGTLDPYEDWRLSADERARDLRRSSTGPWASRPRSPPRSTSPRSPAGAG